MFADNKSNCLLCRAFTPHGILETTTGSPKILKNEALYSITTSEPLRMASVTVPTAHLATGKLYCSAAEYGENGPNSVLAKIH